MFTIYHRRNKGHLGIQILVQYIVNKAEGGATYTGTDAIGWSSLSIMHKEKMSGYIPVHMDLKKNIHTRLRSGYT